MERRALLEHLLHRREAGDRAGGEGAHRPRRDGVDANAALAEVPGEVAHARVQGRLGDAHHVVVRHGADTAEVGHRHHRATAARLHQRLCSLRAGDERVRGDVDGHPEAVARRVDEAALEILRGRERDGVDEQVEAAAERLTGLGEDARNIVVRAHVALGDELRVDRLGELADALLDALALERERELGAFLVEALGDRPCDRPLVGDAQDQRLLALEPPGHATILL